MGGSRRRLHYSLERQASLHAMTPCLTGRSSGRRGDGGGGRMNEVAKTPSVTSTPNGKRDFPEAECSLLIPKYCWERWGSDSAMGGELLVCPFGTFAMWSCTSPSPSYGSPKHGARTGQGGWVHTGGGEGVKREIMRSKLLSRGLR